MSVGDECFEIPFFEQENRLFTRVGGKYMCRIVFAYDCHPGYRLPSGASRDVFRDRPIDPIWFWSSALHNGSVTFIGRVFDYFARTSSAQSSNFLIQPSIL